MCADMHGRCRHQRRTLNACPWVPFPFCLRQGLSLSGLELHRVSQASWLVSATNPPASVTLLVIPGTTNMHHNVVSYVHSMNSNSGPMLMKQALYSLNHSSALVYGLNKNHILQCLAPELEQGSSPCLVVVVIVTIEQAATGLAY